jgi:isopenicillin N synthase-like dioxygenase
MASIGVLSVPVVDLSPFTSGGDLESRKRAANDLAEKGQINGCVGISGHGVPADELNEAFAVTIFDLPYKDKMKAPHPDALVPHRGYSGMGREKGAAKTALETDDQERKDAYLQASDYKVCMSIWRRKSHALTSSRRVTKLAVKRIKCVRLPEDLLPGFREFMTKFFWDLNKTATTILDALIMS